MSGIAIKRGDFGYAGFEDGERITGWCVHPSEAEQRVDRIIARRKATVRACMCCGKEFLSEGAHNRLCTYCATGSGLDRQMVDPCGLPG